jgi:hypothetical protein
MKVKAVSWLEEQLKIGVINNDVSFYDLIAQAEKLEEERIIDAIVQYQIKHNNIFSEQSILNLKNKVRQFYNENLK